MLERPRQPANPLAPSPDSGQNCRQAGTARLWMATAAGILLSFVPVGAVLVWNGWGWDHASDLLRLTGKHVANRTIELPEWSKLQPLSVAVWCVLLGVGCRSLQRRHAQCQAERSEHPDLRDIGLLAGAWLAVEAFVLWSLSLPAAHYYQQLAAPACLLAGVGLEMVRSTLSHVPARVRRSARGAVIASLVVLSVLVALPLMSVATLRVHTFNPRQEAREFAEWMQRWSPASAADHLKREQHEPQG